MKRILLVGGGTGGHIYPLVAVSQELQKTAVQKGVDLELLAVADSNRWRNEFESRGIGFKRIFAPRIRRVEGGRLNFFALLAVPIALLQALWTLFVFMPDAVFSKGGFTSVIPTFVGLLYFIPVFIHESDSVPGLANRVSAGFAKRVFISFENAARHFSAKKTVLSGNPARENLLNGNRVEAFGYFNLNPEKKTVLFLAGSQGSAFINNLVIEGLVQLVKDFQLIHQAGPKNIDSVRQETERIKKEGLAAYGADIEKNYRLFDFLDDEGLKNAYAAADIIVSRSGSGIFELAALGKPAIVVPYPYSAGNHQKENAAEFAKFGAVVLEEQNLKPHILIDQLKRLLKPENYQAVSQRIKQFAKMDAGKVIAEEIMEKLT